MSIALSTILNVSTVQLKSPDQRQPYGVADLRTKAGTVLLWLGLDAGSMGFGLDLTPDTARELGKALLAQAAAVEQAAADQEGGTA